MFIQGNRGGGGARLGPGGETARERLISTLKVAMTEQQARDVMEALETYLEEGERGVLLPLYEDLTPDYAGENEKLRKERDAAVDFAEQALQKMQETLKTLRSSHSQPAQEEPEEPSQGNGEE